MLADDTRNMLNVAISHLTAIADGSAAQHGAERMRAGIALDALRAIVDRPAPTPAVTPRYFRVLTDGSTPSWTIIAARPCDAWRLWVDHEDASGFLDGEALGDGETLDPAGFAMNEISAEIAASRMVDDDGTRRPLTECAIGSVFCSEY